MGKLFAASIAAIIIGSGAMSLGFHIWWHRKINLIALFRHEAVKPEDVEEYTQQIGKACALDRLGLAAMGAFWIMYGIFKKELLIYLGVLILSIAIGFSIVRVYRAQKRYA